ncbi:MAG: ECF transporter S component [Candidatus Limivicinus sp.]|jgi:uncharacterized membrane protein
MKDSRRRVKILTVTAILMAMNIIMSISALSIPVPGGHMYLNDAIIVTAAVLLDPFHAFLVGGVGAFIGDLLFYPAPMFVSLVSHGLQAVVISLCTRHLIKNKPVASSIIGAVLGLIISVAGYTLGRAYVYSTVEHAILKFPFQILQTAVGSAIALVLCWPLGIVKRFKKQFGDI